MFVYGVLWPLPLFRVAGGPWSLWGVCFDNAQRISIQSLLVLLDWLTDTAMLISELTRFDSFYIFSTELLVFLLCRQTDKEFRLPWPSFFVRVEIYYRYRLSINRKYRLPESWIFHSEVVRVAASSLRGHEFESRTIHFPYQGLFFFISLSFFLSQFRIKHCGNLYWKYDNTGFAMEKKPSFFYFFKIANTSHKGAIRHIAWLHLSICKLSIQDTMLLSR